jgi:purine-binding chemotaxis protein CheW
MQVETTSPEQFEAPMAIDGQAAETQAGEYLAFRLGGQEYAVDIMDVQEIRTYEQPTRMVGTPGYVCGVLNLRGSMVPVVDLRTRLGMPAGFDGNTVTVVLNMALSTVGIVVDAVSDVVELKGEEIQPVPSVNDSADARLFHGLGCTRQSDEDRTLLVMNLNGLISSTLAGKS